ncbi:MAG: hypothetical protein JSS96_15435 [Bacteroidetes bacterium]|nr:hypothetical protein [Bacteroidota bacterium]
MKKAFFILILFSSFSCIAQLNFFSIKNISRDSLSFPIFSCTNNNVSDKINSLLQLTELHLLNGYEKHDIFEIVSQVSDNLIVGKTDLHYQIFTNSSKVLSLKFDEADLIGTTHYWTSYYTFNSGNGDLITLKDLFTTTGYEKFRRIALEKQLAKFRKVFSYNPKALVGDTSFYIDIIKNSDYSEFYISGETIILDGNNYLVKEDRLLSQVNLISKINYKEIKTLLNDYGKAILLQNGNIKAYHSHSLSQLMVGYIDTFPIVMLLNTDRTNYLSGVYAYLKNGVGIPLHGYYLQGNNIHLVEEKDQIKIADIYATLTDGLVEGSWQNNTGKKYHLKAINK